jgi:protein-S-isoprenylcysteine O-methyltransferase Ste14
VRLQPWNIVFLAGFIAYCWIRGAFERRTRRNEKVLRRVDTCERILLGLVVATSVFLPVLYLFTPLLRFADYTLPNWAPWCGTIVMLMSLWLFWRSHADLGRNWSITLEVRKGHELIKHGVYRWIRHPMYAAIFLFCVAQGLLLQNWLAGWSVLVAFAIMYLVRTPREERMMIEVFGDQYRDYMRHTGRLLPRIRWKPRG